MPEIDQSVVTVDIAELDERLPELLRHLKRGEEVRLCRSGVEIRRLRRSSDLAKRTLGTWSGLVKISEDFDDPMPDFEDSL